MTGSKSKQLLCGSVLMLGCLTASAHATVMLTADAVITGPGTVAEVGVYATSDNDDVLTGLNIPLDLNGDGYNAVLPAGFTLDATPLQNALFSGTAYDLSPTGLLQVLGADAINTGSGGNVQLGGTPTLLYDIAIDVSADAPAGDTMNLDYFVPVTPGVFNLAGTDGSPLPVSAPTYGNPVVGSVTVNVPEPSLLAAAGVALLTLVSRKRL